jgi:hypothetical protein
MAPLIPGFGDCFTGVLYSAWNGVCGALDVIQGGSTTAGRTIIMVTFSTPLPTDRPNSIVTFTTFSVA